jgi:hypothetical protein
MNFYKFSYSCITFRQNYRMISVRICEVKKTLSFFSVVSCKFEDDVYNEITNIILEYFHQQNWALRIPKLQEICRNIRSYKRIQNWL